MRTICLYFICFLLLCGCTSSNRKTARQTSEDTIRVINPKLQTSETLIKNLLGVEMEDFVLGMSRSDFRRMSKEQHELSEKVNVDTVPFYYKGIFFEDSLYYFLMQHEYYTTYRSPLSLSEKDRKMFVSLIGHLEQSCGKADEYIPKKGGRERCWEAYWYGSDITVSLVNELGDYIKENKDGTYTCYGKIIISIIKPSVDAKEKEYYNSLSEMQREKMNYPFSEHEF